MTRPLFGGTQVVLDLRGATKIAIPDGTDGETLHFRTTADPEIRSLRHFPSHLPTGHLYYSTRGASASSVTRLCS